MLHLDALSASKQYYDLVDTLASSSFESAKVLGKFYTNLDVANRMIDNILAMIKPSEYPQSINIIDPFCGDGRLICLFVDRVIHDPAWTDISINVTLWDIEKETVEGAKRAVENSFGGFSKYTINTFWGDAFVNYQEYTDSFDVCITNPPWGLIKPLKVIKGKHSPEEIEKYTKALGIYDEYMKVEFSLSQPTKKFGAWGTNLGRCGTELALRLLKKTGVCGIVSPASLFNDQISVRLREWIFSNYTIMQIEYYPAELKLFGTADISSLFFVAQKHPTPHRIPINLTMYDSFGRITTKQLSDQELAYISRNQYIIPFEAGIQATAILSSLEAHPTVKEYCDNVGLVFTRELDETRVAEKLSNTGSIAFAKGYMVNRYSFESDGLYLDESIVQAPPSVHCWKLVWRDVSRNSQKRRMKATILPPGHICGNSLGVIYAPTQDKVPYLKYLLAIMNSFVFEYQARSLLVTNHVSAGVIKQIRVPYILNNPDILMLVDKLLSGNVNDCLLEALIAEHYGLPENMIHAVIHSFGLSDDEIRLISDSIKSRSEAKQMIYNHYAAKLSDLDMQIVRCVPPGGNWKDIPESVPSQRLVQIRESYKAGKGSRSTYYGRLKPELPSYTINTYFNRPGNGCNMHYEQDRTLSQREAARLQTFPDSFIFKGSLSAINNQIGNAVPVLLAFQLANSIPFKGQFVDLFCGAGGLALGFIMAGWKPIIANDIDKYAIETHKANIAGKAICGDINSEEVFSEIVASAQNAREENPDLPLFVLGGPPCQGFSTANTRRGADDMRNWLFKSYAKIVRAINPAGFIFENVKGITNLDNGRFFEMIKEELRECIPSIKVCRVNAAEFAIPQRRERVIIVGGSNEFVSEFQPKPCTSIKNNDQLEFLMLPTVIGVKDALDDLPAIEHSEDGSNLPYRVAPQNAFQRFMRGYATPEEYLDIYK